jgi:hypothetical protein
LQAVWVAAGERLLKDQNPRWSRNDEMIKLSLLSVALILSIVGLMCGTL